MEPVSIKQGASMINETINVSKTTRKPITSTRFLIDDCPEYRKNNARKSKFYSCQPQ
ncbi:Uncharacterized protein APZ42_034510 [Daphnia magna]|nr:Uncharacterized protein APZ42_034510 [Daphnia magna]